MWIFFFSLELLGFSSTNSFIEKVIKLFDVLLFDTLIFSDVSLWNLVTINQVVKLLRVASFDFDPHDVKPVALLADRVEISLSVKYI